MRSRSSASWIMAATLWLLVVVTVSCYRQSTVHQIGKCGNEQSAWWLRRSDAHLQANLYCTHTPSQTIHGPHCTLVPALHRLQPCVLMWTLNLKLWLVFFSPRHINTYEVSSPASSSAGLLLNFSIICSGGHLPSSRGPHPGPPKLPLPKPFT